MSVKSLIAATPSGRSRPLLIDDADYSTAVVRQGMPIPWTDTTLAAGHFVKVRALLDPDALWIDVERLLTAHTDARPDLVTAMGARTRTGYPLRTLLTDAEVLSASRETLETVARTAQRQLLLHVPSPAAWLASAHRLAGNPLDAVDADRADSASMYIAEWLGQLGSLPIALILLDARDALFAESLAPYSAVANVASHFDWTLAMWNADGIGTAACDLTIGVLGPQFWTDAAQNANAVPESDVLVTSIPASASPEHVLDQLTKLT
ncbi:hypothetical protein MMAG44476_36126 [Mycolicibacterium mageritense DSM 44476 = CIP 104973]|uniref:Uncharacterized protein n=1 Tax=Mycolicibacterium mageritense TaxID=53462 RepID=A0AAI8TUC6_MYCME|nr:hypothetical protein [Mycolicibacterium mageritense]TXI61329.1 MAG: hypothetical protein E6Q55_16270 [Mycolicibacterium mageritense]CDO23058.1 hypothetical protein BN978_03537 [Mycolicibacterium mageritense DSM 44476 = CIP 104973]BBX32400.1 hypothetical protein MMAGJ_16820 [Mycolicibacterium mageritense]BDY28928.1 hypothetical protein hbim_02864 [Mycolicibacterium mageritense]GJJ21271.1 hypothetical protein MTY414_49440 [Mycolicibacterium mageritense]